MHYRYALVSIIGIFCTTHTIKRSHLSDNWYPHQDLPQILQKLDQTAHQSYNAMVAPSSIRALIAPHAGITYSGAIAAAVYRLLDRETKTILLLAPDHAGHVDGVALPAFHSYQLPYHTVIVDTATIKQLTHEPFFAVQPHAFDQEHSLEMHLIFLAYYLPQARIIPLTVGSLTCTQASSIAQTLAKIVDKKTVVAISSDFIHYGPRFSFTPFTDHAQLRTRHLNSQGLQIIEQGSCTIFEDYLTNTHANICGSSPIKILLNLKQYGFFGTVEPRLIGYDTSHHADADNSVSYIGMIFTQEKLSEKPIAQQLTTQEQKNIVQQARDVLLHLFDQNYDETLYYPLLSFGVQQSLGAFTTLNTKDNKLRGCIGRITTQEPLYKTIAAVTGDSALHDSRFAPVTAPEVSQLSLKLSILSRPEPIADYRQITVGTHGIILRQGNNSAVFLPEVPGEFGWNLSQTLSQLSEKAGLPAQAWKQPTTTFEIFSALTIAEGKK